MLAKVSLWYPLECESYTTLAVDLGIKSNCKYMSLLVQLCSALKAPSNIVFEGIMSDVFISYSRKDISFTQ